MEFKPLIQLSQMTFRMIIGHALDTPSRTIYKRDEDSCIKSGCPIAAEYINVRQSIQEELKKESPDMLFVYRQNKSLRQLQKNCRSFACPYYKETRVYQKAENKFSYRLPKSALRLYLLLFALPQEMLGKMHIIRNLNIDSVAEVLKITRATVVQSLISLQQNHYITYSHAYSDKMVNIIIRDYENMYLPAKRGGSGYITITDVQAKKILNIKHVNDLRLELYSLLRLDEEERLTGTPFASVSIHDLKHILPKHQNYTGKTFSGIVEKKVVEKRVEFVSSFSMRYSIDSFRAERLSNVNEILLPQGIYLTEEQKASVAKLSVEYSVPTLAKAVTAIYKDYYNKERTVASFGALLRHICIFLAYAAA